jgi:ribosome-binding factor A
MNRHHRPGEPARARQKTAQLCRQVYRTLVGAIAAADDDALLDVNVESVEPCPDATRLLVLLRATRATTREHIESIHRALDRHRGRLRSDVARSVTRKRAPELVFHVSVEPHGEESP